MNPIPPVDLATSVKQVDADYSGCLNRIGEMVAEAWGKQCVGDGGRATCRLRGLAAGGRVVRMRMDKAGKHDYQVSGRLFLERIRY